jgi:hypothetical protein
MIWGKEQRMVTRSTEEGLLGAGSDGRSLQFLEKREIRMIDEALGKLGEFGEVRLVVEKGRLRYVVTQRSYDALKWSPGQMV